MVWYLNLSRVRVLFCSVVCNMQVLRKDSWEEEDNKNRFGFFFQALGICTWWGFFIFVEKMKLPNHISYCIFLCNLQLISNQETLIYNALFWTYNCLVGFSLSLQVMIKTCPLVFVLHGNLLRLVFSSTRNIICDATKYSLDSGTN